MTKILFLPGAGASPDFWKPVGALLPADWSKEYFGWPGLGDQPHDPAVKGIDDLVRMVAAKMDGPVEPGGAVHGWRHRRAAGDRATAKCTPAGADRDVRRHRHGGIGRIGLARELSQVFSARHALDHRGAGGSPAAGREDRLADAAAVVGRP